MEICSRRGRMAFSGITSQIGLVFLAVLVVWVAASEGKVARRLDTHAHFVPPFYYDLLKERGSTSGGQTHPKWNATEHLKVMDFLKIDTAILSISAPGAQLGGSDDVEEARALARKLNEYGNMVVASHPGRFQFFATLCLPDVEGSIAEAIYALDTLKAAGVIIFGNSNGIYLGSKKFDPLMEVLNERSAIVFVHPTTFDIAPVSTDPEDRPIPTFVLDFLLDTTRAAINLVLNDVFGRYPNIKFILSHSGGFTPFAAYRMAGGLTYLKKGNPLENLEIFRNFYGDTALSSTPTALPSTLSFFREDHLTFGSDYPYAPNFGIYATTGAFDEFPIEDEQRHKFNYANADKLFATPLAHWRDVWAQDEVRLLGQQDSPSSFKAL